jgi:hypothetical protein
MQRRVEAIQAFASVMETGLVVGVACRRTVTDQENKSG